MSLSRLNLKSLGIQMQMESLFASIMSAFGVAVLILPVLGRCQSGVSSEELRKIVAVFKTEPERYFRYTQVSLR